MINIKELYWIAGFLEGEACFYTDKKAMRPRIVVSQKEKSPLLRLQKSLGGVIRYSNAPSRRNPIFIWDVGGSEAIAQMMTLWGLMSDHRKAQIEDAIERWKVVKSKNGKYISKFFPKPKLIPKKKLSTLDVLAIRAMGASLKEISKQFGITENYAYRICKHMRRYP